VAESQLMLVRWGSCTCSPPGTGGGSRSDEHDCTDAKHLGCNTVCLQTAGDTVRQVEAAAMQRRELATVDDTRPRLAAVTEDETLELFRFFAESEHTETRQDDSLVVRALCLLDSVCLFNPARKFSLDVSTWSPQQSQV
jgi:hypothetical protein